MKRRVCRYSRSFHPRLTIFKLKKMSLFHLYTFLKSRLMTSTQKLNQKFILATDATEAIKKYAEATGGVTSEIVYCTYICERDEMIPTIEHLFEEETKPLTDFEKEVITNVIELLKNAEGKEKALTNKAIRLLLSFQDGLDVSPARIRKIINHIRTEDLISCLVASSKGYYIAKTAEESKDHLESLYQRSMSILNVYSKLKTQSKQKFESEDFGQLKIDL